MCGTAQRVNSKHSYMWVVYNHGCQAGSIRHRLSRLLAAATRVLTRLSAPSNVARSAHNRTAVVVLDEALTEFTPQPRTIFLFHINCDTVLKSLKLLAV